MIDEQTLAKLGLTRDQGRVLSYILKRAEDEFKFPITLEFVQARVKRDIYLDVRGWIAVALSICGKGEWTRTQAAKALGLECHKTFQGAERRGRSKWRGAYWKGFAIRWQYDVIDLFEYA